MGGQEPAGEEHLFGSTFHIIVVHFVAIPPHYESLKLLFSSRIKEKALVTMVIEVIENE